MSNGYYGVEAMMGEKGLDIRNLADALKKKQEDFQEKSSKRGKWRGVSDLIEKGLNMLGPSGKALSSVVDVGSEQLIQKFIPIEGGGDLSEYETMWTGGEAEALQEEFEKMYEASDETLKEGLMRLAESEVGGEFMSKMTGGLEDFFGDVKEYGFDDIPKYKNGGLLSKLKFGKKKKPEKDEALVTLETLLSKGFEPKEGKHEFPTGQIVASDEIYPDMKNLVRTIAKFSTPEGDRYYPGEGKSRDNRLANTLALMDASSRAFHSPADSITTDQLEKLRELGLFAGGGQVPKYYGGGSVSGNPTISDYFSKQGKTLGGSNTDSLAEKLGMK